MDEWQAVVKCSERLAAFFGQSTFYQPEVAIELADNARNSV